MTDIKAGEEICMCYGSRSNQELLIYSGFVSEGNTNDELVVEVRVPQDELFKMRKLILKSIFLVDVLFFHFLSYSGASFDKELRGRLATSLLLKFKTIFFEFVVFPIIEKSKSHFLKIFFAFSTFPEFNISNILSWLSESIIS